MPERERRYTVRWTFSSACLVADPETGWRWSDPSLATVMTLAEAEAARARMGGVILCDGRPIDRPSVALPKRPKMPRQPAGGESPTTAALRAHVAAGRWREATRLAMKLRGLGEDKAVLERAWDGYARPAFCCELGRDPNALIAAGIEVLRRRFGATPPRKRKAK